MWTDPSATATGQVLGGEFTADITSAAADWQVQLAVSGLAVNQNDTYYIAFDGRSAVGTKSITVVLRENGGAYTEYHSQGFTLNTSMTRYQTSFTMSNPSDPAAQLLVYLGSDTTSVTLDNFSLSDCSGSSSSSSTSSGSSSTSTSSSSSSTSSSGSSTSDPTPSTYMSGKIPNAKYIGRWDTAGAIDKAYWPGAYMKVKFTGTTAKIEIDSGEWWHMGFAYSVDGAPLQYMTGNDISALSTWGIYEFNLTPTPLSPGTHTLKIASGNGQDVSTGDEVLHIRNLILDGGATTVAPDIAKHVEFIGDSITMGWGNAREQFDCYGWLIGMELGVEHTHIARSGITTGGMNSAYFQTCYAGNTSPWDFSVYHPDVIFINLGQNDGCVGESTYGTFLSGVRAEHPDAWILCMIPFNTDVNNCSKTPMNNAVAAQGDPKMVVVDGKGTDIGLINGVDYHDSVELHPNEPGNRKIADHFKPIIQTYLDM